METAIEVRNLRKTYRSFSLDGVSFTLPKGEVLGFIGPNGAGKTTTIRIMLGLARPDSGTVSLLGGSPSDRTI
ncbi:MAG: ATP-binding cassette domain-containing protein, partial [Treponema sp.]